MNISKTLLCTAMLAAVAFPATAAGTVPYVNSGDALTWWGTSKSETYDVAVYLGSDMKGVQIQSVSFPVATDPEVSGFSIWLSSELRLDDDKKNAPDVLSSDVEVTNGTLSLTLPQPYTIGEEGIYIGYSFTVTKRETDIQKKPVAVVREGTTGLHGLYAHSSRTFSSWTANAAGADAFLPFEIELGGLPEHAVTIALPAEIDAGAGSEIRFDATLTNYGYAETSSVEIEWSAGDMGGKIPVSLSEPLPALYRVSVPVSATIPSFDETGDYELDMKVVSANGTPNAYSDTKAETTLHVWRWLPKKMPLLEEYTGTGCGYCPRGELSLKKMEELYGDDFVGLAYHHADVMSIFTPEQYPNPAPAQPVAWLDRTIKTDPYFGDLPLTSKTFGFEEVWNKAAAAFTPADMSLSCTWTDDSHSGIKADADMTFVKTFDDCDFRISYIIVADGLKGDGYNWTQGNYYSGQTGIWPEEFDWLVNSPKFIDGLVFDHVAIFSTGAEGIAGSIPTRIEEGQKVSHSITLSLDEARNLDGTTLVQDGLAYSVVAVLTDASTGEVLNCARKRMGDTDAVEHLNSDNPVTIGFADLLGRSLSTRPDAGIYLEIRRHTDGRLETRKIAAGNAGL